MSNRATSIFNWRRGGNGEAGLSRPAGPHGDQSVSTFAIDFQAPFGDGHRDDVDEMAIDIAFFHENVREWEIRKKVCLRKPFFIFVLHFYVRLR